MDRARRIASLWNWLPVFRAVAETENLHAAATTLHVSPSAVSRTVKLLEQDVGHALFIRRGRSVRLNEQGRSLLVSVRDAMRLIDDGLSAMSAPAPLRSLRIACSGDQALPFLGPPVLELRARLPQLAVHIVRPASPDVAMLLLRGDADVVVTHHPVHAPGLVSLELGRMTHGVYCSHAHPLAALVEPSLDELAAFPFLALSEEGASREVWPHELRRSAAMFVPALAPAIELCATTLALAVLPDACAGPSLHRLELAVNTIPPTTLHAIYREPLAAVDVCASLARSVLLEMARPR